MGFRNRKVVDIISPQDLADFGRFSFLGEASEIGDSFSAYGLIEPLVVAMIGDGANSNADLVRTELRRHAATGPWEAVGAWKFARDFLPESHKNQELIDAGLLAVDEMKVSNLAIHLASIDIPRFEELTGRKPPIDGFFGPPTFDSEFGPTRQFYFDKAVSAAAARKIVRLPSTAGVEPQGLADVTTCFWDLGLLIYRGPAVVSPDIRFEPNVVRRAKEVASNVDHELFVVDVSKLLFEEFEKYGVGWSLMGAGRFIEDYLEPCLTGSPHHVELVDAWLRHSLAVGEIDVSFSVDVFTPLERERMLFLSESDSQLASEWETEGDGIGGQ